jgi:hypothetical protein
VNILDKTKYKIERRYIDKRPNVRPGTRLKTGTPAFFVAHDTGNPGAGAENHYSYFNTQKDRSASAHVFIDDKMILEIIPTGTGGDPAEKAWHVLYNVTTDNERFGYDSNDAALAIELCYGESRRNGKVLRKIDFDEAYKRYVWYLAYCCDKWGKNPFVHIPSHRQLDPARKRDVDQALATNGKTLKDLLNDVATELKQPASGGVTLDFEPIPANVAQSLIATYISPIWYVSKERSDLEGMNHFHNLANNLRLNAGIPIAGTTMTPVQKLPKSNTQEIIYRWLSPAWFEAKSYGRNDLAKQLNETANLLRKAAGLPVQ